MKNILTAKLARTMAVARLLPMVAVILIAATMWGCGGSGNFTVKGEIVGDLNTNLYIKYYGNGAVQTLVTVARDGKFEAKGRSKQPTLVEILDNTYRVLGRFYAKNGDEISIKINPDNPYRNTIDGNDVNRRWAKTLTDNADMLIAGDKTKINNFVAGYIADNADDVVSTLLFVTLYDSSGDPAAADALMQKISADARVSSLLDSYAMMAAPFSDKNSYTTVGEIRYRTVKADSARTFTPSAKKASLIVLSDDHSERRTQILPWLKSVYSRGGSDMQIFDVVLLNDTAAWRRLVARDSAQWIQGWVPGGILGKGLDQLAIPAIPYYIVTDNSGKQVYRGTDTSAAADAVTRLTR